MTEHRILDPFDHQHLLSTAALDELAWAIDADGLARHEDDAERVVSHARIVGLATPLVDVLADREVPLPVRERAFGKVVHALAHTAMPSSSDWALAN